jgi:hypothetical protein
MRCVLHSNKHRAVRILRLSALIVRCAANDEGPRNCRATLQFRQLPLRKKGPLSRECNMQLLHDSLAGIKNDSPNRRTQKNTNHR